jgi:hypothetical protein
VAAPPQPLWSRWRASRRQRSSGSKITGKSLEQRGGADRISWQRHQITFRPAKFRGELPRNSARGYGSASVFASVFHRSGGRMYPKLGEEVSRRSLSRARTATPYSPDCFRAPSRGNLAEGAARGAHKNGLRAPRHEVRPPREGGTSLRRSVPRDRWRGRRAAYAQKNRRHRHPM